MRYTLYALGVAPFCSLSQCLELRRHLFQEQLYQLPQDVRFALSLRLAQPLKYRIVDGTVRSPGPLTRLRRAAALPDLPIPRILPNPAPQDRLQLLRFYGL